MTDAGRPRALFVGHSVYAFPLKPQEAKKWDLLAGLMDIRIIGAGRGGDARFRLIAPRGPKAAHGVGFYAALPAVVRQEVRRFRPDVVVCQSPFEGAMVQAARVSVPVIVEVHGDWGTAARDYGSRGRRVLALPADRVARWSLRHADGHRTVGPTMTSMLEEATGRAPLSEFPTWFDGDAFRRRPPQPLGDRPTLIWVGVLQPYKNPDVLASAWPGVVREVPQARLVVVGRGPQSEVIRRLIEREPGSVEHHEWLPADDVAAGLDDAWALVLPSRSEGLPRIGIEALLRGRPIIGSDAGGIPDLVRDGINGVLVPARDSEALRAAVVGVLSDRAYAERLAVGAQEQAKRWAWTPEAYGAAVLDLVRNASRRTV